MATSSAAKKKAAKDALIEKAKTVNLAQSDAKIAKDLGITEADLGGYSLTQKLMQVTGLGEKNYFTGKLQAALSQGAKLGPEYFVQGADEGGSYYTQDFVLPDGRKLSIGDVGVNRVVPRGNGSYQLAMTAPGGGDLLFDVNPDKTTGKLAINPKSVQVDTGESSGIGGFIDNYGIPLALAAMGADASGLFSGAGATTAGTTGATATGATGATTAGATGTGLQATGSLGLTGAGTSAYGGLGAGLGEATAAGGIGGSAIGGTGLTAGAGAAYGGLGAGLGTTGLAAGTGSLLTDAATAGATGAATGAGTAALVKGATGLVGGLLQGETTKDAQEADAAARAKLANEVKDMGKFTPVGITTTYGTSNFVTDPVTGAITPSYTLSPTAKAWQEGLTTLGTGALSSATDIMNLGNQYIGESPEAVRQRYIDIQKSLLAPGQESTLAGIRSNLSNTGRGGLSFGATSDGMMATNPELAAYYNSLAMTDRNIAADSEKSYKDQVNFGTGLLSGATKPFTNVFDASKSVEAAAQEPLKLSTDFANTAATRGAATGANYANAMSPSLSSTYNANTYDPFATFLQGMSDSDLATWGLSRKP